ncbi:MAG: TetR/AcrR family transcriptional regulator [Anaerocolumna sp.]|jgi:AcrR family transcriptional regulator|nr:TetR/AcrR family transcriptional regulator [Anaerocolumna sp.]
MGSKERKEKEMNIRRNDIIDAAESIFFERGYGNSTMDDVAKKAEFSKRTIYVYFSSKEQIYFEIMIRGYRLLLSMLKSNMEMEAKDNAIDEIKQIALTFYHFSIDYSDYFWTIMEYENSVYDFQNTIPDQSRDECYALGEEILMYLERSLTRGIAEGTINSSISVNKTALILWACMLGVFNTSRKKKIYLESYHEINQEDFISGAFELIIQSLQTKKGGIY